ncbi:MAG: DUF6178 family protein [Desulfobacteraceae bacterium]|nr:DUF6178 family protein [Desulfobacteraceae bacterium]
MIDGNSDKPISRRLAQLRSRRDALVRFSGKEALERILGDAEPPALVHSLSEEDLYLLLHDLDPEDALPLLALASHRQKEYLLDMEIWDRDRIDVKSLADWTRFLYRADPKRNAQWLMEKNPELVGFLLIHHIDVAVLEEDQDPGSLGEGFITFDQTFYLRVSKKAGAGSSIEGREFEEFFHEMMRRFAETDYDAFRNLLQESAAMLRAEYEEEAYRLRNVRLAEKGFLPFEEAVGIYQPVRPDHLRAHPLPRGKGELLGDPSIPVPIYPSGMLASDSLLASAIKDPSNAGIYGRLQVEFAAVCNRIVSADRKTVRSRKMLKSVVDKADKTISIGLERLTEGNTPIQRRGEAARIIGRHPLTDLFRLGYGAAAELKWKAEAWRKKSWFVEQGLPLTFWGERWLGLIGGLFVLRPRFFDEERTDAPYREFGSMEEIRATAGELDRVVAFDDLLARLCIPMERPEGIPQLLTYKNLVLTLWARHTLALADGLVPLSLPQLRRFLPGLWTDAPERRRTTSNAAKERFLGWLAARSGLSEVDLYETVGSCLEDLFGEIEDELGGVPVADLDPRFIQLFLVRG